ncbi:MAG: hypothetical protein ABSH32_28190, partial [Bryobacteraceae bacterium]
REVTVDCPLECEYLQEARKHERPGDVNPDDFPHKDIRITEEFLENHEKLVEAASRGLMAAAFDTPGAVDRDVRETLDALIRTYLTLQSGVYYETRPVNALANQIFGSWQAAMEEYRKSETERLGMSKTRDADVLGTLVFLQRLELDRANGRPRGRAFLDFLRSFFGEEAASVPRTSSLILP